MPFLLAATGLFGVAPAAPALDPVAVPVGIDATGGADVTDALQRFIDAVPDGREVRFPADSRYRIDGTLLVVERRNLVFDGNGAVFMAVARGGERRSQWLVRDSARIVFRDMTVRGAHARGGTSEDAYVAELEAQHGFELEGVDGVELDTVRVTDVYGDFVYVGRNPRRQPSRNVWIHDSTFMRNGRQGIAVTDANGVVIEHNDFAETRRSTIDLEPNAPSWRVSDVFVLDNTVGEGRLLFVASHGQGRVNNVVIARNALTGHALTVDVVAGEGGRRSNWIVDDNTSDTPLRRRALRFRGVDGVRVRGNRQPVSGEYAVALSDVCGARITDNDFDGAGVRRVGGDCGAPLVSPARPAFAGPAAPPRAPATPTTLAPRPGPRRAAPPEAPARGAPGVPVLGFALVLGTLAAVVVSVMLVRRAGRGRPPAR
jgi:hypothetical protein